MRHTEGKYKRGAGSTEWRVVICALLSGGAEYAGAYASVRAVWGGGAGRPGLVFCAAQADEACVERIRVQSRFWSRG